MPPFGPLTINFNQVLKLVRLRLANFSIRHNGNRIPTTAATVVGATVVLESAGGGFPDPGPNVVDYFADPENIRGGIIPNYPAAPFADFPFI